MRKTSVAFKATLAVGFAAHLMASNPGEWILLVAYVWGLGLGFAFFGPAFEELLASLARIKTDPSTQISLRTRRSSTPDQNRNLAP